MSVVPKLRFKHDDGSDFPNWEEKALGELIQSITNGTSATQTEFQTNYPVTRIETISDRTVNLNKVGFVQSAPGEKYLVRQGDILFSHINSVKHIGKTALYEGHEGNLFHGMNLLLIRSCSDVDYKFLFYMLNNSAFLRQVRRKTKEAVSQASINTEDIKSIRCAFPSQSEQQKIASFLSSVDKKIDLLRQKKDALELYKKGLMQKIFSQEIRFKQDDGSDFPDWEEVALGDVASITTGTGNREDSQETGQYIFFDRSTDIRWSDRYEFDQEAIIVAGEGKSFPPRYFVGKFSLHQRAYAIYDFKNASARFLYYMIYLRSNFFLKMSVGSTMPSLRMNAFIEFPISLPCPTEQQKIAEFLSALDARIQKTSFQVEQMETFKKGLLQQMFV